MKLEVMHTAAAAADEAARHVAEIARSAVALRGRFLVALSGGSTPRAMHARLVEAHAAAVDWSRVEFYWSDERLVPPDHPDSNYRMARETLLDPLAIAPDRVHRARGEGGAPSAVAEDYARAIAAGVPAEHGVPVFDLVLLGMGGDGHTASLFPFTDALDANDRWVVPNVAPRAPVDRVTLTFPVIFAARAVRVVVTGADKADALGEVLQGPSDPRRLPAQRLVEARGDLCWIVDGAAIRS
jgi:6-phosphogluconolactonase